MMGFLVAALALVQQPAIEELIRQLRSDEAEVREKASAALIERGADAVAALKEVSGDSDPEVAARAKECLVRIDLLARSAPFRKRISEALLKEMPDLPERLAGDESELLKLIEEFRGIRYHEREQRQYHQSERNVPVDQLVPVFSIMLERRDAAAAGGEVWKRFDAVFFVSLAVYGFGQNGRASGDKDIDLLSVDRALDCVASPESEIREAGVHLLGRRGVFGREDRLLQMLKDGNLAAPGLLASAGCLASREPLREWMKSGRDERRRVAIEALGELCDVESIPEIVHEWGNGSNRFGEALEALGLLESPAAAEALIERIKNGRGDLWYRELEYLKDLRIEAAIPALKARLEKTSGSSRGAIIQLLAELGAEGAFELAAELLKEEDDSSRHHAKIALTVLKDPRAIPLMKDIFVKGGPKAGGVLYFLQDNPEALETALVIPYLDSDSAYPASRILAAQGTPEAVEAIKAALSDPQQSHLMYIVGNLRGHVSAEFIEPLAALARGDDRDMAAAAVERLAEAPGDDPDTLAAEMAASESEKHRNRGYRLMGLRKKEREPGLSVKGLKDEIDHVRYQAFKALKVIDPEAAVKAAETCAGDPYLWLRIEALLVSLDKDRDRAMKAFVQEFESKDEEARVEAAIQLAWQGDGRGADLLAEQPAGKNGLIDSRSRGALLRLGDRRGARGAVFIMHNGGYTYEVFELNRARAPKGWKTLSEVKLAGGAPAKATLQEAIEWLGKSGVKIEADPEAMRRAKDTRFDLSKLPTALDAVVEIGFGDGVWGLIEDDGRVRICRYVDYRRAMLEWFNAGR